MKLFQGKDQKYESESLCYANDDFSVEEKRWEKGEEGLLLYQ